jgi:TolA-binding protein
VSEETKHKKERKRSGLCRPSKGKEEARALFRDLICDYPKKQKKKIKKVYFNKK